MTTLEQTRKRAEADAKTFSYYLTPQPELLEAFLEGLKANEDRYGYPVCPCRLATGILDYDRDIICPCDYRDPDIAQYGACYCRLYVTKQVYESQNLPEVPERRPIEKQGRAYGTQVFAKAQPAPDMTSMQTQVPAEEARPEVKKKLWYCKQCGYVVFREDPPYVCPICKAKRDLFAPIESKIEFNG